MDYINEYVNDRLSQLDYDSVRGLAKFAVYYLESILIIPGKMRTNILPKQLAKVKEVSEDIVAHYKGKIPLRSISKNMCIVDQ